MDRIHRTDLKHLVDLRQGPCVSLFMPMHVADRNATEDPIRLRGLADEAEKKLMDHGMRRDVAAGLLAPLRDFLQDTPAWLDRGRSLAFFAASGFSRAFHGADELPASLAVAVHFCLLPLWPLSTDEARSL